MQFAAPLCYMGRGQWLYKPMINSISQVVGILFLRGGWRLGWQHSQPTIPNTLHNLVIFCPCSTRCARVGYARVGYARALYTLRPAHFYMGGKWIGVVAGWNQFDVHQYNKIFLNDAYGCRCGGGLLNCYKIVILNTAFVSDMKSVGLHKNKIIYLITLHLNATLIC